MDRDFASIGARKADDVLYAGMPVGNGLSKNAADEMGLVEGTPVGSAIIDACVPICISDNFGLCESQHTRYAGWLGTVAARYKEADGTLSDDIPTINDSEKRLAVIAGTSTCHIVQSKGRHFVDGVWGPYKDPIIRGWWMNEGGQSSTGQVESFPDSLNCKRLLSCFDSSSIS